MCVHELMVPPSVMSAYSLWSAMAAVSVIDIITNFFSYFYVSVMTKSENKSVSPKNAFLTTLVFLFATSKPYCV